MAQRHQDELHVSNDHVAEADVDLLKAKNGATTIIGETVDDVTVLMVDFYDRANDPCGDDARELLLEGFSEGFVELVLWAAGKGARKLRLDADGARIDELPVLRSGNGAGFGR